MTTVSMPSDFLPLDKVNVSDRNWSIGLPGSLSQRFEQQCGPILKALLARCCWSISVHAGLTTLVITCPDSPTHWQVLYHVSYIGRSMAQLSPEAKVCIYPPTGTDEPFEIGVNELVAYQENCR